MRAFILLLGLFLCLSVEAATGSAAADTWYIRPSAICPNNGDGLAYNCAASGGASGAFSGFNNLITTTTVGIDDGDTVKVCGSFVQADAETANSNQAMFAVNASGASGAVITFTGNCTAEGGAARASLTSNRTSGSLIRTYNNTYLTFTGTFDLSGAKDAGITLYSSASAETAVSRNIRIEGGTTITDILTGAQPVGITYSGTDGYIGAVTISNVGVDGILQYSGGNWIIEGTDISNISVADANGDCIQLQRVINGNIVFGNYCDKRNKDSKQCYIASCFNGGNSTCATGEDQTQTVQITDNQCLMAETGSDSIGIYSEGQATIARNYIDGARTYGITCGLDDLAKCTMTGNIITDAAIGCIDVSKTSAGPMADIYNNTMRDCGTYGIDAGTATAAINIRNNTITGTATNGIYRGASGTSDSYNNVYGPTTPYSNNGVAGSAGTGDKAVDPGFIGGSTPTSAAGFRLSATSQLRRAGKDLNIGAYQDNGGRAFLHPPSIGAWEVREAAPRTAR